MFMEILPILSAIMIRFFGLFIVLPVISIAVESMGSASELTIGLAMGAPYISQIIFQPIFGILSDRYDRKSVTVVGILIFALGSMICSYSEDVYMLVFGRFIQGLGAVGGVMSAIVADIVKEEFRSRAMAVVGIGIFMSFVLAMIVGSLIGSRYSLSVLFDISAALSLLSVAVILIFIEKRPPITFSYRKTNLVHKKSVTSIFTISVSTFIQKLLMVMTFMLAPPLLLNRFDVEYSDIWVIYLSCIILSTLVMGVSSVVSEKIGKPMPVLFSSIVTFSVSYVAMLLSSDIVLFSVGLALYFMSFTTQEALLQGLVSKYSKAHERGKVLGSFNSYGFAGSFVGSILGGVFHDKVYLLENYRLLFFAVAAACLLWLVFAFVMLRNPVNTRNLYIDSNLLGKDDFDVLDNAPWIIEWYINEREKLATIKYSVDSIDSGVLTDNLRLVFPKTS